MRPERPWAKERGRLPRYETRLGSSWTRLVRSGSRYVVTRAASCPPGIVVRSLRAASRALRIATCSHRGGSLSALDRRSYSSKPRLASDGSRFVVTRAASCPLGIVVRSHLSRVLPAMGRGSWSPKPRLVRSGSRYVVTEPRHVRDGSSFVITESRPVRDGSSFVVSGPRPVRDGSRFEGSWTGGVPSARPSRSTAGTSSASRSRDR